MGSKLKVQSDWVLMGLWRTHFSALLKTKKVSFFQATSFSSSSTKQTTMASDAAVMSPLMSSLASHCPSPMLHQASTVATIIVVPKSSVFLQLSKIPIEGGREATATVTSDIRSDVMREGMATRFG